MKTLPGFDRLGLSTRDSRVYVALLTAGVSSIRAISDSTGINRGSVYESLKALSARGLVSHQQANINKKYFAEDPDKIIQLIESQQETLEDLKIQTKKLVPKLVKNAAYSPYANIKFYEDHEGVAVILKDILHTMQSSTDKTYYAISSKPIREYLYKKFPSFTKQRIKHDIFVQVIAVGDGGDEVNVAERRWLNAPADEHPSSYTLLYGNKYATISLNEDLHPYGIVIEDNGVADMQKLLFKQLWDSLQVEKKL